MKCSQCGRKDTVEKIPEKDRKKISCPEYGTGKKQPWWNWRVVAHPGNGEAQQSGIRKGGLKSTEKGKDRQRDVRRMFKILREV